MRGSIKQRSKGSWTIWVELERDPVTDKRRRQTLTVRGTKKEAEAKLREVLHQLDTGSFVTPSKLTVADFLHQWLESYASSNCRQSTYDRYKGVIEDHLIPDLGALPLSSLKPAHLQEHYAKALKVGRKRNGQTAGLSAWTVRKHHVVIREALSHAVKWGLVGRNVVLAVDPPKPPRPEAKALDSDAAHRVLEVAQGTIWHPIFHLALYTGMRRGEILGLRWKDVDLTLSLLYITQTMQQLDDGRIVFEEPKTAKSRRAVALSPAAAIALRSHREMQEAEFMMVERPFTPDTLVFERADGTTPVPDSVTHAFTKYAKRAGVTGVHLHNLRHTHASLMLKAGVHPKIVSERLGHSSVAFTLDTYSHVAPGLQEAAALKFDETLNPVNKSEARSTNGKRRGPQHRLGA
jgi:integrase